MTKPVTMNATGVTPKPQMTDQEVRLECAKLAVQSRARPADVIKTATSIYNFVKSG